MTFVKSFQREDGHFYDPWLMESIRVSWKKYPLALLGRVPGRSESRCSDAVEPGRDTAVSRSSGHVGRIAQLPSPVDIKTPADVDAYFD